MGKKIGILSIFMLAIFLSFQTPIALADNGPQDVCKGISFAEYGTNTRKDTITNADNKARFIIDIGEGRVLSNYRYQMEFICGLQSTPNHKQDAEQQGDGKNIYYDLKREWSIPPGWFTLYPPAWIISLLKNKPCEFSEGIHEIWVTVKASNLPVCRVAYEVGEQDSQCKLSLFPDPVPGNPYDKDNKNGITPATTLLVHGENLNKDADFKLFLDNIPLTEDGKHDFNLLDKVKFDFYIPRSPMDNMKQGKHRIDIRRIFNPYPIPSWGPSLCPRFFTMGTPTNPGKVLDETDIKECKSGPNCSSGASQECTGGTKPSVKTAIGCIHTNPADLIQDVLKFGVGIGGGVAFLMMLLGAFQMLTSAGNPETLQAGKDRLTSAVIGLLIIIFSVLLLQIIGFDILGIPEFGRS